MPDIYLPGVRQSWAGTYGWPLSGGPRKFILHSTETDSAPAPGCVDQLCHYLDGWANPTLVWDPWTGDMAMCGRADWAMGALVSGNKDGSVVLQVEAVGRAGVEGKRPFADSPMLGWDKILAWADSWGIPRIFPAGLPLPYPQAYGSGSPRDPAIWAAQSGYYGHSQVPANDHGDPGLVDLAKIFPKTGDEVSVLPTVNGADHTHPKSLALLKNLLHVINPATDTSTDAATVAAVKGFQMFFKVPGGADGVVGPETWRMLLKVATGGGK